MLCATNVTSLVNPPPPKKIKIKYLAKVDYTFLSLTGVELLLIALLFILLKLFELLWNQHDLPF